MKVEKENAIGGRWKVLSLQDYLREKSEESRYNQTQAHLLVVLGVVLFSNSSDNRKSWLVSNSPILR